MTTSERPGWKTTEFWLTVFAWVATGTSWSAMAVVEAGIFGEGSTELRIALAVASVSGLFVAALANAGYSVARGIVKAKEVEAASFRETGESAERVARLNLQTAEVESERRPQDPTIGLN